MNTIVESNTASINTLSVTIKALHVNNKQMTLAVFRQLPAADFTDEAGKRVPGFTDWGIVRYAIKDEADIWLVSEKGGQLFRLSVQLTHDVDTKWLLSKSADIEASIATLKNRINDLANHYLFESKSKSLRDSLGRCEAELLTHGQRLEVARRWNEEKEKVAFLPQLFIAV